MLIVVAPCSLVLGVCLGYRRGRDQAERDFATAFTAPAPVIDLRGQTGNEAMRP